MGGGGWVEAAVGDEVGVYYAVEAVMCEEEGNVSCNDMG